MSQNSVKSPISSPEENGIILEPEDKVDDLSFINKNRGKKNK